MIEAQFLPERIVDWQTYLTRSLNCSTERTLSSHSVLSCFFRMKTRPPISQGPPSSTLEPFSPSRNWKRKKPFIYEMISRAPLGSQILGRSLLRYSKGGPLRINSIPLELPTFFVLHELFFRADGHDLLSPSLRWKVVEFSLNVAHSSITKKGAPLDGVPNI